jgi:hypothetical protein
MFFLCVFYSTMYNMMISIVYDLMYMNEHIYMVNKCMHCERAYDELVKCGRVS